MSELRTFRLPATVSGTKADADLASAMIQAWRREGIFQIDMTPAQVRKTDHALDVSRRFFRRPLPQKAACISDLTYSGYIASGEELTAGEADHSEIFTVCPDVPVDDPRVQGQWPCHGPVPWPDVEYRDAMKAFMGELGTVGERLLRLTALGLGLHDIEAFTRLTRDGWHHMRVLRFPSASSKTARGIGAHTDYGLLVIAAQDDVGGLYIRPPVLGERRLRNWLPGESTAGRYEDEEPWNLVRPVPSVLTVFPGDILQFMTGDFLLSTPHKVRLAPRERYSMAYFHEPNFAASARPLFDPYSEESIHYGTHFTSMFMRCYPERITTRRIIADGRQGKLRLMRGGRVLAA